MPSEPEIPESCASWECTACFAFTSNVFIPSFATTFTGSRSEIRVHSVPHRTECAVQHVGGMLGGMIKNPDPFLKRCLLITGFFATGPLTADLRPLVDLPFLTLSDGSDSIRHTS